MSNTESEYPAECTKTSAGETLPRDYGAGYRTQVAQAYDMGLFDGMQLIQRALVAVLGRQKYSSEMRPALMEYAEANDPRRTVHGRLRDIGRLSADDAQRIAEAMDAMLRDAVSR